MLALGGAAKVARPDPTAGALLAAGAGWLARRPLVRTVGAMELALGIAAALTGSPPLAALVAATYLAFAAFVVVALRAGTPVQSCGCFGATATPPSSVHVLLDAVLAGTALASAAAGVPSLAATVGDQPWSGIPFLGLVALMVYLCYLLLTALPQALAAAYSRLPA